MANKQKAKGSSWERDVCKIFTEVTGSNFQRVPNSGAFVGGKNAQRLQTMSDYQTLIFRGDIIPPEEYNNLVIECKAYKEFQFHNLTSGVQLLDKWIDQIYVDIEAAGDETLVPLVIFKINRKGMFVVSRAGEYDYTNTPHTVYHHSKRGQWFHITTFSKEWVDKFIKEK
jgi:Holliday junction resolvase